MKKLSRFAEAFKSAYEDSRPQSGGTPDWEEIAAAALNSLWRPIREAPGHSSPRISELIVCGAGKGYKGFKGTSTTIVDGNYWRSQEKDGVMPGWIPTHFQLLPKPYKDLSKKRAK